MITLGTTAEDRIAAAAVTLSYSPEQYQLAHVSAAGDTADIMVRSSSDNGIVTIGLVASADVSGDLVDVWFREHSNPGVANGISLDRESAYRADERRVSGAVDIVGRLRKQSPAPAEVDKTALTALRAAGASQGPIQPADLPLEPAFANYPLGDVTKSGELDVLDVLRILNIALGNREPQSAYEWYHADLNSDGLIDVLDVKQALGKAVDPNLPASLQVAPRKLTFEQVRLDRVPMLVGNAGNQPFSSLTADLMPDKSWSVDAVEGVGLAAHSAAFQLEVFPGWKNGVVYFRADAGAARQVLVGNTTLLIVGQSNATGYGELGSADEQGIGHVNMLRNDFEWLEAYEPIHDNWGQVQCASYQDQTPEGCDVGYHSKPGHSFAVSLGKALHASSGRDVYIVPAARKGSTLWGPFNSHGEWWPPDLDERLDRSTLFGNANFRAQVSAGWEPQLKADTPPIGGPVTAIVWYQGESEATRGLHGPTFVSRTNAVMNAFAQELYAPPVLYVQLGRASSAYNGYGHMQHIREFQGRMEADFGETPRENFFMVVTHDLPMVDRIHLSAEGQRILGERLALAYRQHVLGEKVNGTGPRLESISWAAGSLDTIDVTLDRPVNAGADNYSNYFYVREGDETTNITASAQRFGDRTIRVTLTRPAAGEVTLSYEPPLVDDSGYGFLVDVVRDHDGLPLPAFGPRAVTAGP